MYQDVRSIGRSFALVLTGDIRTRRNGRRTDNDDHPALATPEVRPDTPPRIARLQNNPGDEDRSPRWQHTHPALEGLQVYDRYTRVRILADDRLSRILYLNADEEISRHHFLDSYRTNFFLEHLSDGRYDEFPEMLCNQEYDSYFCDLRARIASASTEAGIALGMRSDPQQPPRIALTIPPAYEPSDLPPYTATTLPPRYSVEVPRNHIARDASLCVAADCPVGKLGIEHSCGLYHHNGQVGPMTAPQGVWLPSFSRSNPPPKVWRAYNRMVLGVANPSQVEMVGSFIRCHGAPWKPMFIRPPPILLRNTDIPADMEQLLPHGTNQRRMGRVPCPVRQGPNPEIQSEGSAKSEEFDAEAYMNTMHYHTHLQAPPRRHHRRSHPQTLAGTTEGEPDRPQVASTREPLPIDDFASADERLHSEPPSTNQRSCHRHSARQIPAENAALVPEPLRIPSRLASLPRTSVPPGEGPLSSQASHHGGDSRDPSAIRAHHGGDIRDPSAIRDSIDPAVANLARLQNTLPEVSPRLESYTPTSAALQVLEDTHRERRRHRRSTHRSHGHRAPPNSPIMTAIIPRASTTLGGGHIRQQPFYGHVYNVDRGSTRQPTIDTNTPRRPRLHVSNTVTPASTVGPPASSANHARTNQDSPYPLRSPQRTGGVDTAANRAGGILGAFDWETNVEHLNNEQLLAVLRDDGDSRAGGEVSDADAITDEMMYERYADTAQAGCFF